VNVLVGIAGLLLLQQAMRSRRHAGRLFLIGAYLAVLAELVVVALPTIYGSVDSLASVARDIGRERLRVLRRSESRVALAEDYNRYANLGQLLGFRSATAYDPLLLGRTSTLLRASQDYVDPTHWGSASNEIYLHQDGGVAFDLLGIGYVLDDGPAGARLRARESHLPRLSVVPDARVVATPAASLAAVMDRRFDPRSEVILEWVPETLEGGRASGEENAVVVTRERPGYLEARVEAPRGGYLLFSESYYPGWQAEANGQVVPLAPADHAIMAVRLSPGSHAITLRFTTPWLVPGLALSCVGILGMSLLFLPYNSR
jgi:hypothetical protein